MNPKTKARVILVISCFYLLCPADVFPDILPGIGNVDDMFVMLFGAGQYFRQVK